MDLTLECPTKFLPMIQPFSDYDFIIAQKALEDKEYAKFFKGTGNTKVYNLFGADVQPEDVKALWEDIGKGVVMTPLHQYATMVNTLFDKEGNVNYIIGIMSGDTYKEAMSCLSYYGKFVAVPYDIVSKPTDSPQLMCLRRLLIVSNIPSDIKIHLLGFNSIDEFWWYQHKPNIIGINTGVPVWLGLQEADILDPIKDKSEPTMDRMEKLLEKKTSQDAWTAILRNIALLRKELS